MKKINLLLFVLLIFVSCKNSPEQVASSHSDSTAACCGKTKDGLFIHITESYNDPHRLLMPLKMANMMAEDKDVLVYLDIKAVEFLAKGAKDIKFAEFESAQTYIKSLIEKKVGVYACPTCLKISGIDPSNLMDGVQTAQKDKFFDFTKGRIITLDY